MGAVMGYWGVRCCNRVLDGLIGTRTVVMVVVVVGGGGY